MGKSVSKASGPSLRASLLVVMLRYHLRFLCPLWSFL